MKEINKILELVNYNLWANKRIINWLKTNDQELMAKECNSSFCNIYETLNHILDGEILYYSILIEKPIEKNSGNLIEDIGRNLIKQSEDFIDYIESKNSLDEIRSIKTKYIKGKFHDFELIQHCMNHSTFHRGQIVTMGHQIGLNKAPSTDMLFYFIKRSNSATSK